VPGTFGSFRYDGTDADDPMKNMLRKFVAMRGPYFLVRFPDKRVGGSKSLHVKDRLDIPYDDAVAHQAGAGSWDRLLTMRCLARLRYGGWQVVWERQASGKSLFRMIGPI
jgi:hypothetical protein